MKHELAVLFLWLIAFSTTFFLTREPQVLTHLGPVFAVCMIGSVLTVRAARRRAA